MSAPSTRQATGLSDARESAAVEIGGYSFTLTEPSWQNAARALELAVAIMEGPREFARIQRDAFEHALAQYEAGGHDISDRAALEDDPTLNTLVLIATMGGIREAASTRIGYLARHADEVQELLALVTDKTAMWFNTHDLSYDTMATLVNEAIGMLPFGSALDQGSKMVTTYMLALRGASPKTSSADTEGSADDSPALSDGGQNILDGMARPTADSSSSPPTGATEN